MLSEALVASGRDDIANFLYDIKQKFEPGTLHGTVVESWSMAGELSLFCARPAADG